MAAMAGLFATAWALFLQSRVNRQTRELQVRLERERALESRFQELFDHMIDFAFTVDREGRFTALNQTAQRVTGLALDEARQRFWWDVVAPEDRERTRAVFRERLAGGSAAPMEVTIVGETGIRVPFEVSLQAIQEHDRTVGLQGLGRDLTERRKAEEALRDSERRYRELVENVNSIILHWDQAGHITFINEYGRGFFGYRAEELLGRHVVGTIVPESEGATHELRTMLEQIVAQPTAFRHSHQENVTRSGARVWISWTHRAVFEAGGALQGVFSVGTDVTEQRRAEESMRTSEERFRAFLDHSPMVTFMKDVDGRYLAGNRAWAAQFGQEATGLLGRTDFELWPEATARSFRESDLAVARSGRVVEEIEHGPGPDGKERWWSVLKFPVPAQTGGPLICGIVQDVTDRRRAEVALAVNEAMMRGVMTNAPVVLFALDPDGVFVVSEGKGLSALGLRPGEVLGRSVYEVYRDYPAVTESIRRAFAGGIEAETLRVAGRVYETWYSLVRDAEGTVTRLIGVAVDVTERERMVTERRQFEAKIQQAQKLESLGVLAGGIAHDFNNILTAVLGNINLAIDDLSAVSPAREELLEAAKATHRAADLTKQMLAYSGKGRFVIQNLDLREVIEEMTHLLEISISKQARLKFNLPGSLPAIRADAAQLRQLIMNLVINASEAIGDRSGVIAVSVGAMDCDVDYLADTWLSDNLAAGHYVYVEVADTGCGIDKSKLPNIFDPFYSTKFTGRGLGLAAVLGIVRGHHGAIKVYSEVGRGTTFKALFPAVDQRVEPAATSPAAEARWKGSGTVLLADDEDIVRFIGIKMLERLGFTVLTAEDGQKAVEMFEAHQEEIVCVLMDLTMPHMDGEEAFRELRRLRPDVRVVLASGYSEQDVIQRFSGKGLSGFIQKPFTLESLTASLKAILPAGKAGG
ncbi:MAG: PAS domain-containing hybrid sensor histidine kinase/response regulator, partial [Limisphaerales bacterium]